MILLQQMTVLFLIMLVGFVCRKRSLLNDEASRKISGIVVNVANPALVLSAGINKESAIQGQELFTTFLLAFGMFFVMIGIGEAIPRLLRAKRGDYGVFRVMTVFSNIGFMGFPVIQAVYGSEALLYASLFMIPYNLLIYTYGIRMLKGEAERFRLSKVLNIGVIACIISMILYLARMPVPQMIEDTVSHLSNLTAPLSMIVIGDSIAQMNVRKLFTDGRLLGFSLIKLLLLPVAGIFFLRFIGINELLLGVCMIMLSTPVGSMTAMLAQQYDANYEMTSKGVALTTLLAVATMPVVSFICGV